MGSREVLAQLITWTPYLLEGFAWNMLIALAAGILGTAVGGVLVWLVRSGSPWSARCGRFLSNGLYRVPTVALMFYCVILLPKEFVLVGTDIVVPFPSWIKAVIALSASPAGFTARNFGVAWVRWQRGEHGAALLFLPAWGANLLITIIASSAASLVGVSEIVSRSNRIVAATQSTDIMLPLYFYVSLFFLLVCLPFSWGMQVLRRRLMRSALTRGK